MSALARKLLVAFGVLGLAASTAASWVHYHLIINPDYASFCDVNATISCKQAYFSRYGSVGGVPVALNLRGDSRTEPESPDHDFFGQFFQPVLDRSVEIANRLEQAEGNERGNRGLGHGWLKVVRRWKAGK